MILIDRRLIAHFDWGLLSAALLVPLFGLIVLYSAGYDPDVAYTPINWLPLVLHSQAFAKQFVFLGAGLALLLLALLIPQSWLFRGAYLLYGGGIGLLVAVLLFGRVSNGSRRWLDLGPIHLQPAELMKLGLVLALSRYLARNPPLRGGYRLRQLITPGLLVGIPFALVVRQPDLGTALVVGATGVAMVIFMGVRWKILAVAAVLAAVAIFPVWNKLHPYQQQRVMILFNPEADAKGSGYHIRQSKIAVGSGSLFGKGYLKGTQAQLEFLPEHTTDFVFCVLAEEWGFLGCAVVIAIYLVFLYRLLRVVQRSRDSFSLLLSFGLSFIVFFHTIVNMGMVVGLLPVVGIPLPLFSYGGSSVVSTMFALGIILGVSMRRSIFVPR